MNKIETAFPFQLVVEKIIESGMSVISKYNPALD